ncbi:uncharacterized protein DS421_19g658510 [Arachis hypogaea]|uniref:Uncharacterized protein n=1 Tax=Arachis hypogaea TaxID=3818 RepID=A0A6B9VAU5_ARAHY|nr:uncharacterized protein DS421_19g658510 [Arachis hypogaea]
MSLGIMVTSWHGWHTSWCPQTNQPSRLQQLRGKQGQHGSGTSNQSANIINQSINRNHYIFYSKK